MGMTKKEMDMMGAFVREAISEFRPHLKASTLNSYWAQIRKLMKASNETTLEFLRYPEMVKSLVNHLHFTSQRNTYNAVSTFLLAIDIEGDLKETITQYEAWRDELNTRYTQEQKTGIISQKQEPNFVTIDELQEFIASMKRNILYEERKGDVNIRMVYVLFEILVRYPLRNDLAGMTLTSKRGYNKLTTEDKQVRNWLVSNDGSYIIIDNVYKTSKNYGENQIPIESETLNGIISGYIRKNKFKIGDVLFPITSNYLSQLLIKYSQQYMGKSISTTMIRKIVTSDKFLDAKLEQEKHAKILGHSVGTENAIYIKQKA
jgi:anion-transporting  ArsA/GET3 family ATPase|tara:strand:- start:3323 stop:4276 length:954 start_codon:yes stop_codon:yes gene_type:complete